MIEQDYSKMSQKEFEKIIYQTFPVIFKLIKGSNKYVFNIGSGWFPLLYELCEQLNTISNKTRIDIVATEIEEHFGVFKFHYLLDFYDYPMEWFRRVLKLLEPSKFDSPLGYVIKFKIQELFVNWIKKYDYRKSIWEDIIYNLVERVVRYSVRICSCCGEYYERDKKDSEKWLNSQCEKCLKRSCKNG